MTCDISPTDYLYRLLNFTEPSCLFSDNNLSLPDNHEHGLGTVLRSLTRVRSEKPGENVHEVSVNSIIIKASDRLFVRSFFSLEIMVKMSFRL